MVVINSGLLYCDERKSALYKEYMMTQESLQQDIEALKLWITKQPHLPDISELNLNKWLEGILLLTKNSVERAKQSIDLYFTARAACPGLFFQRNLQDPELKDSFNHVKVALMPGLTEEGHRVLVLKIDSPNPAVFNLEAMMKRCSMIIDFYLQHGVDFSGLHVIHDLEHIGLGHISRFSLELMKVMAIGMKSYPCRIPKITLINTPYFADKVLALFRPFMSPKLMARVTSFKDSSQLLDILSASLVPADYGGQAPPLDELNAFWRTKLEESADFFALCDSLKTDERKRIGKKKIQISDFGPNGSFRQLSVD